MKVGILGGGQLGRMLALAGYPLGMTFRILDPAPDACAGQVVADHLVAGFDDEATLKRFAQGLDVVTYEWENVPVEAVRYLSGLVRVEPSPEALEVAQDRFLEKSLFRKLGIRTTPFAPVGSLDELKNAVEVLGLPSILKTRRLGYDGKGHYRLDAAADAGPAWQAMGGLPLILEGVVPFRRELSILAVRGRPASGPPDRRVEGGADREIEPGIREVVVEAPAWERPGEEAGRGVPQLRFYPLVENVHREGILHTSRAPAGVSGEMQAEAESIAERVMEATGYAGVLAIELFEHEGRLLANEMAPRVHNSGHWTIEGAETSQFENHLRAICGLSLGPTSNKGYSAMVNLIGKVPESQEVLRIPGAHLHLYGKEARAGRKLGHVTVRSDDASAIDDSLSEVLRLIENSGV